MPKLRGTPRTAGGRAGPPQPTAQLPQLPPDATAAHTLSPAAPRGAVTKAQKPGLPPRSAGLPIPLPEPALHGSRCHRTARGCGHSQASVPSTRFPVPGPGLSPGRSTPSPPPAFAPARWLPPNHMPRQTSRDLTPCTPPTHSTPSDTPASGAGPLAA